MSHIHTQKQMVKWYGIGMEPPKRIGKGMGMNVSPLFLPSALFLFLNCCLPMEVRESEGCSFSGDCSVCSGVKVPLGLSTLTPKVMVLGFRMSMMCCSRFFMFMRLVSSLKPILRSWRVKGRGEGE